MVGPVEKHKLISRDFFSKANDALVQDDLLQASEKLWGAEAHMVKAVAEVRGWQRGGHRDLFDLVNVLAEETGDPELRPLFHIANSLHSNFYEDWMTREWIEDSLGRVGNFLDNIEAVV